ncbi:Clp protease ClpB [Neisseria arctica]|uniref:Clp protease ClpB n=1 Tax=Neisseria arctica TaxID=1470200 RepID=A0A0J0YU70_9NEIS|nr:CNP1-like family protein [Neisseria arctica]KLT73645.1 Clp protease ClpB [Neisseria arctica]UOO85772.1 CNP1-like family protein [Neisseria arctica]
MRRLCLLAMIIASAQVVAASRHDKDTLVNTRYVESAAERAANGFKETEVDLPPVPDTRTGEWFELHINNDFNKSPLLLLDSLSLAPDGSVRYILNTRSVQGYDNLSAEGFYCAGTSLAADEKNRSSFKTFAYADTVNQRWIRPRNAEWKPIGAILNTADPIRSVIYRAFCIDGVPGTEEGLKQRIRQRSGRYADTLTNTAK